MKVVLERQLARKVDDSKAEKDQFWKEINHLRTQLENLKGKSIKTKFDKHSIFGKPLVDKLLINTQISKSWFTPKVDMQKSLSKPVTIQSVPKNEKDQLLKQIAYLESKLASQDIRSCQKEYHELRTLESVSAKVHMGESSKPFSRRVSQFTTYSFQKDRKFSKNSQSFETLTPQKGFKKRASNAKHQYFEATYSCFTPSDDEDDVEESNLKDDSEEIEYDNDGDNLTHPSLSTYKADDQEEEEEKANDEEVSSDQRVSTPPDYDLTDEEENKEGDDNDKDAKQEQDEEDDLYRDVNLNLEKSDTEITDAQVNKDMEDAHMTLTVVPPVVQQQSSSVLSDFVSKFINPSLDTDSVTTTIPTMTLPDIPNFASLFQFEQRVSVLETEMSEFKQTHQFAEAVSLILGIVDNYLAFKMKEVVDSTMKTIIKEQVQAQVSKIMPKIEKYVTKSLGAEVLVRSTNQPQTSYAVVASLLEFELKKIFINKMEENKSINRSNIQKNIYNALVESYNSDKYIISSYGDVVTLKRGRDDQDKDEDPSAGSNRGSKSRRSSKEVESAKEPTHKESKSTSSSKVDDLEDQTYQEFNTGNDDVTPVREALNDDESQWNPSSSPTLNHEWNKTKTVDNRPPQPWITQMAQAAGTQSSFNEFLATPIDFSAFIMHRLKIDNMTQEVLTGPTYDLIKGMCKSVVELEYHLE
ncbi:hypothetical protein Tco_1319995 [Tanacetum coccineum]